ncbi:type II toxin-antitoxin system death-on-curing family toxin [Salinarimonas sp.]|uniref:type II toxin-antitoxin system death-on-curing family toxin n=1 Tax=Salinarimonas sp. TaxID=2766526 RepID=UPI0032D90C3F
MEPGWLTAATVVEINRREVARTGEPFGLLRPALLESAVASPRNLFAYSGERALPVLAARLLFGIAPNHPFAQGNKRAAFTASVVFLRSKGRRVAPPDDPSIADLVIAVIEGSRTEAEFIAAMTPHLAAPA